MRGSTFFKSAVEYKGKVYYYYYNLQGDVVGLFDTSLNKVVEYTYDSWGKLLSTTGSMASTLGKDNPFRYRSYYYDEESGLYYLNSRYYDPVTGRFVNADGIVTNDLLGGNLFAYCGNNPVTRSDPSGHFWEEIGDFFTGIGETIGDFFQGFFDDYKALSDLGPSDVPYQGEPGSHVVSPDGTKERVYGPDGLPDRDRHHTDHGNPKHHPNPHDHDWEKKENGKWGPGAAYPSPNAPLKPRESVFSPALNDFSFPKLSPLTGHNSIGDRVYEYVESYFEDYYFIME